MTPAGTSNELDVQNEWEENTHTQQKTTITCFFFVTVRQMGVKAVVKLRKKFARLEACFLVVTVRMFLLLVDQGDAQKV